MDKFLLRKDALAQTKIWKIIEEIGVIWYNYR